MVPNSWGDKDRNYAVAIDSIWTGSKTKKITHCQTKFVEAFTRYHEFRNRTNKLDKELSSEEHAKRIGEQITRREIMDKMFNKAVEEEEEERRKEALKAAQEEEDRKKVRLLAEQVRLDCVPLYSDIPLCGEDSQDKERYVPLALSLIHI